MLEFRGLSRLIFRILSVQNWIAIGHASSPRLFYPHTALKCPVYFAAVVAQEPTDIQGLTG